MLERWKPVKTIHDDVLMIVNRRGEYVLHRDCVHLEMKYAKKSAEEFKRYKNCVKANKEIDELKAKLLSALKRIPIDQLSEDEKKILMQWLLHKEG